jgi:hypothetical protein
MKLLDHQLPPGGQRLWSSRLGEVGEFSDLVDFHLIVLLA